MKKRKKWIGLILLGVFLFTSCRPEVDIPTMEKGEVSQEKEDLKKEDIQKGQKSLEQEVNELLNPKIVFEPGANHEKDALSSYYKRTALSEGESIIYDEIYQSIMDYHSKLTLTKQIPVEQLRKIMNIIILDTPELFHLENKYSYKLGLDEKVESINFYYIMDETAYKAHKDWLISESADIIGKMRKSNSYDAFWIATKGFQVEGFSNRNKKDSKKTEENDEPEDIETASSIAFMRKRYGNSFGVSKAIVYYLRESGVEAFLKVGILNIDNPLQKYGYDFQTYHQFKRDEIYKEYSVGNDNFIEIDLKGLHAYVCAKLTENDYFNYDYFFSKAFSSYYELKNENEKGFPSIQSSLLGLSSDYHIAQTRSFFINEKLLGVTPLCNSDNFMEMKKSGLLLPHIPKEKMTAVAQKIVDNFARNGSIYYQFSDYETYELFIKTFDSAIDFYNKNSNNAIKSYKTYHDATTLLFVAYELVSYE